MKILKLITVIGTIFMVFSSANSAILWVGDSPQCNQSNHFASLNNALITAAFNGNGTDDEIRLTNTVSYTGNSEGAYVLSGWNSLGGGELTIEGGYDDCDEPRNGANAVLGFGANPVFDIKGESVVTLINMQIGGSQSRGLVVDVNSSLFLEEVDVSGNNGGVEVLGASYLSLGAFSVIQNNGSINNVSQGGGVWCQGNASAVNVSGTLNGNRAQSGGNIYVTSGCSVTLEGGSRIKGGNAVGVKSAVNGGAVYVDNGGLLFVNGGASRVFVTDHWADSGGAIYVTGTGRATILNAFIARNKAPSGGSGLFAINGGSSATQVIIDRANSCPLLISCSEFEGNEYGNNAVVYVHSSRVQISRTIFEGNVFSPTDFVIAGLVESTGGGYTRLSHINMLNNEAVFLVLNWSQMDVTHLTAVGNSYDEDDFGTGDSWAWVNLGNLRLENSIWQDTQGGQNRSSPITSGKCNLVDVVGDWPSGSYTIGTADFINPAGGDARQISSSDGVDMCQADTFAWNIDRDIEYQVSPVNENTNPQGAPGESGGLYDAGFDEVYDNIGEDEFLLTVQKEGSGSGSVVSTPLGIACGTDCTEVYFNGTVVTLFPNASPGSEFIGWRGCPFVNSSDQCQAAITESETIFAEFQPDDLIFSDGFE